MRIESDNLILSFPRKRESSLNPSFTQTMDSRFRGNDGVWLTFLSNQDLICAAIVESTALGNR